MWKPATVASLSCVTATEAVRASGSTAHDASSGSVPVREARMRRTSSRSAVILHRRVRRRATRCRSVERALQVVTFVNDRTGAAGVDCAAAKPRTQHEAKSHNGISGPRFSVHALASPERQSIAGNAAATLRSADRGDGSKSRDDSRSPRPPLVRSRTSAKFQTAVVPISAERNRSPSRDCRLR